MRKKYFFSGEIRIFFLVIFITLPSIGQSLEPKFDQLTMAIPNCVLQDINGFIWIGAQEGLIRYDGYKLKKYRNIPFDSTSLSANFVNALAEDKYGNLWVGTFGGGLNYFDQRTERFTSFKLESKDDSTISSNSISKIIVNKNGSLWVGTMDCGLFYVIMNNTAKLKFTHYNLKDSYHQKDSTEKIWIIDLYVDNVNCLWIGTKIHGLKKLNTATGEITHYIHDPNNPKSLSHNSVSSICVDSLGNIWLGTGEETIKDGGGLNMFDRQTEQFIHFRHNPKDPTSLFSDQVYPLLIDSKGVLWMGFPPNKGIASIPISELLNNKKPDFSLSHRYWLNFIQSIYEDRLGNIWFAQFGRRLYKYDRQKNPYLWYHRDEAKSNTMSSSGVTCIYIDRSQNIWFGHQTSGLDKYNLRTGLYTNYLPHPNDSNSLNAEWITGIYEDRGGFLWIATMTNGLYRLNPQKGIFQRYGTEPGELNDLKSVIYYMILLSKTGKLWISSMGKGLIFFDPVIHQSRHIDINSNKIEDEKVISMFEDQDGTIWIGTNEEGLYGIHIENNKISKVEHYSHNPSNRNSLSYNSVNDVIRPTILDSNALWIATDNGLNRFDLQTKSFTHFFEKEGIPDNFILKVLEDNQGNIWIACAIGIGKYDMKTRKWKSYGMGDGMPFETFGGARQNTAKSRDGQLFFSGGSGTIGFYPEQIKDNPIIPPVRLTDFKIFHESVKLDTAIQFKRTITLSHDQNAFSFEFAALNFTSPEKNKYAYKMEGFHDNWIYIGNERTASFTNLDAGEYIFRVKGSNNHGIWNEKGTSLIIIITPPWWATWWFRTITLLTILGIVYSIHLYRLNRVRELERLRIQIASDLHDEIGSALTKIAVHSEIIGTTTEKTKVAASSQKIGNMSREIITTLSDVVWSIDSRNDTVGDLIDRMRDFLETVFPAGSVHIDFQTRGLHFEQKITQALRQNIYLIFKEAVNNAAKHSGADEIKISLINGDGKFKMEIEDNGTGIGTIEKHSGHHGMENMQMRAKRIGGELRIERPEKGTCVVLIAKNI